MNEKIIVVCLLIAGVAAIAYGILMENNYVFIAGIIMVVAGYCLIRKDIKRSLSKQQQDTDTSDTLDP